MSGVRPASLAKASTMSYCQGVLSSTTPSARPDGLSMDETWKCAAGAPAPPVLTSPSLPAPPQAFTRNETATIRIAAADRRLRRRVMTMREGPIGQGASDVTGTLRDPRDIH